MIELSAPALLLLVDLVEAVAQLMGRTAQEGPGTLRCS